MDILYLDVFRPYFRRYTGKITANYRKAFPTCQCTFVCGLNGDSIIMACAAFCQEGGMMDSETVYVCRVPKPYRKAAHELCLNFNLMED